MKLFRVLLVAGLVTGSLIYAAASVPGSDPKLSRPVVVQENDSARCSTEVPNSIAADGAIDARILAETSNGEALVAGTTLFCDGTLCGGTGGPGPLPPRHYRYVVSHTASVSRVDVGVHFPMAWYYNVVMPLGWTMRILPDNTNDAVPYVPHGTIYGPTGTCKWVIRWSGPAQPPGTFELGFSTYFQTPATMHQAEWDSSDGSVTNWSMPCGLGPGPVHTPFSGHIPVAPGEEPESCCSGHGREMGDGPGMVTPENVGKCQSYGTADTAEMSPGPKKPAN